MGQGQCFGNSIQRLIRLAEKPQAPRGKARHRDPRILRIENSVIEMSFRVVEQKGFLKVFNGQSELATMHESDFQRPVTSHREPRVREALCQAQKLLSDLASDSQVPP